MSKSISIELAEAERNLEIVKMRYDDCKNQLAQLTLDVTRAQYKYNRLRREAGEIP